MPGSYKEKATADKRDILYNKPAWVGIVSLPCFYLQADTNHSSKAL
jgi:hypothetical protein